MASTVTPGVHTTPADHTPADPTPEAAREPVRSDIDDVAQRERRQHPVVVTCVDYSPDRLEIETIDDVEAFLARHRPPWVRVRWIEVVGLGNLDAIRAIADKYQLHPLAVEDVLHPVERPKVEDYPGSEDLPGRLFVVARAVDRRDGRLQSDQVSMFLGRTTLVTFQDVERTHVGVIRQRLRNPKSRVRENDASFLLYVLLDEIVDAYYPVLDAYSARLEDVEDEALEHPSQSTLTEIHAIKRDLMFVRRSVWPMRELIAELRRDAHECLSETSQTYLRDVDDHLGALIDRVETDREVASSIAETYVTTISNRANDVVKVLTIIGTIFIPLTFLAGVYGMNMPIPENQTAVAYPAFWVVCLVIAGGMLLWFRRRGWL